MSFARALCSVLGGSVGVLLVVFGLQVVPSVELIGVFDFDSVAHGAINNSVVVTFL